MDAVIKSDQGSDPDGDVTFSMVTLEPECEILETETTAECNKNEPFASVTPISDDVKCIYESDPEYDEELRNRTVQQQQKLPHSQEVQQTSGGNLGKVATVSNVTQKATPGRPKISAADTKGKLPYACNICSVGFSELSTLTKHIKYHKFSQPPVMIRDLTTDKNKMSIINHLNKVAEVKRINKEQAMQQMKNMRVTKSQEEKMKIKQRMKEELLKNHMKKMQKINKPHSIVEINVADNVSKSLETNTDDTEQINMTDPIEETNVNIVTDLTMASSKNNDLEDSTEKNTQIIANNKDVTQSNIIIVKTDKKMTNNVKNIEKKEIAERNAQIVAKKKCGRPKKQIIKRNINKSDTNKNKPDMMKIIHTKQRLQYRCNDCRIGFKDLVEFSRHVRKAKQHARSYSMFECAICSQSFSSSLNLGSIKKHMETHIGSHPVDLTIQE